MAHATEWRKAIEAGSGMHVPQKTFNNWRVALQQKGFVEPVPGRRYYYRIGGPDHHRSAIRHEQEDNLRQRRLLGDEEATFWVMHQLRPQSGTTIRQRTH
jgi:hypothetical protein